MQIGAIICKLKRRKAENFSRKVKENKIEMNTGSDVTKKLNTA
jgi:hypothetical protein